MADVIDKKRRSELMAKIKGKNTKPEILVRKYLYSMGLRYRIHDNNLPGKPDIKISKFKYLILVNGCFWHGHKNCKNYVMPKSNKKFWDLKIKTNIIRDQRHIRELKKLGWKVLVVWECQLKQKNRSKTLEQMVNKIFRK